MFCSHSSVLRLRFSLSHILFFTMAFGCLWSATAHAMMFGIEEASLETATFVRATLKELGVSSPELVQVFRCNDRFKESVDEAAVDANMEFHGLVPRYIHVNEHGFATLTEKQKRFVVARAVMAAKSMASVKRQFEMVAIELSALFCSLPLMVAGGKYFNRHFRPGNKVLPSVVLAGCCSSWPVMFLGAVSYLNRGYEQEFDLDAATFSGDINGAIEVVEAQQKRFEKQYPRTTLSGRFVRALNAMFSPFSSTQSTTKRIRYLRELAQEQQESSSASAKLA